VRSRPSEVARWTWRTLFATATDALSVGRAFGPPIEREGTLVIPVAWVAGGGGGGGADVGEDDHGNGGERPKPGSRPGGGGGGFGGFTWPLGVYVVKDGYVRFVPAVDATRIALAGIALLRATVKRRGLRRLRSRT